jgi:N-acetylneuraminic acid mutarotase
MPRSIVRQGSMLARRLQHRRSVVLKEKIMQLTKLAMLAGIAVAMSAETTWKMAAPLPSPIGEIMGSVIGDKWYVMGGLDVRTSRPAGVAYVFDPANNTWAKKNSMPVPAHHLMTAVVDGRVYVFGGFVSPAEVGAWQPTSRSWVYEPAADVWREIAPMPTPRGAGWAADVDGKIYVIGGAQANVPGHPTNPFTPGTPQLVLGTVEEYNPATNQWRSRAPMPTPRNHLLAAAVKGKIYAIGGRLGSAMITMADDTDVIEEYDPVKDQWANKGRAPVRRSGIAGGAWNGRIYVAGGEYQDWEGAKAFWAVQSFDPATSQWTNLPKMQLAHHGFASGFIGNTLHVAGGGFQSDGMPGVNTKTAIHEVFTLGP